MFPSSTKDKEDALIHGKNAAGDAKDDITDAAYEAGRKVRNFLHSAGNEISQASHSVTTEIRRNPLRSSAIALGVGVLLGALLRR